LNRVLFSGFCLIQVCFLVAGDPDPADIDKIFSQWDKPNSPGCAVGVVRDGKFIFKKGYGMANLEYGLPNSPDSVFRIASTSKQFAAMAMALLAEEGKVSLDDDIRKHLPEMPEYERPVTIRQLIHHNSGIRDYLTLMSMSGLRDNDWYSDEDVMNMLARQKGLNFKPGEEHLYSNSGYFLLSQIILRVSGQTLRQYAHEKIFKPLGMSHTHFHDDHSEIVPKRASGYRPTENGFQISMTTLEMCGDGGVFTTVEDLLKWDANFYNNQLGKGGPALIEQVLTPGKLNNGEVLTYAFGLTVRNDRGLKLVEHGGSFVGYRAEMIRYPEKKFSVIVLCNLGSMNPSQLAGEVADLYLADAFEAPVEKNASSQKAYQADPASFQRYAGHYYRVDDHSILNIVVKDQKLYRTMANRPDEELLPVSEWDVRYASRDLHIAFQRNAGGTVTGFRLLSDSFNLDRPYQKFTPYQAEKKDYEAVTGKYYCPELDVTYSLVLGEEGLELQMPGSSNVALASQIKGEYHGPYGIRVVVNPSGDGLLIHAGRVKNLAFVRK